MLTKRRLTKIEKAAGLVFREEQQTKLMDLHQTSPTTFALPTFMQIVRHECPGRKMISTALRCSEKYIYSPAYVVHYHEALSEKTGKLIQVVDSVEELSPDVLAVEAKFPQVAEVIPAGKFGFFYKEGICKNKDPQNGKLCGQTQRSKDGVFVPDTSERPPIEGRVAR